MWLKTLFDSCFGLCLVHTKVNSIHLCTFAVVLHVFGEYVDDAVWATLSQIIPRRPTVLGCRGKPVGSELFCISLEKCNWVMSVTVLQCGTVNWPSQFQRGFGEVLQDNRRATWKTAGLWLGLGIWQYITLTNFATIHFSESITNRSSFRSLGMYYKTQRSQWMCMLKFVPPNLTQYLIFHGFILFPSPKWTKHKYILQWHFPYLTFHTEIYKHHSSYMSAVVTLKNPIQLLDMHCKKILISTAVYKVSEP